MQLRIIISRSHSSIDIVTSKTNRYYIPSSSSCLFSALKPPNQLRANTDTGHHLLRNKADSSPSSNTEIKNEWGHTSTTPYTFKPHHRDKYAFTQTQFHPLLCTSVQSFLSDAWKERDYECFRLNILREILM